MRLCAVPQIEGLRVSDFESYIEKNPNLKEYVPDDRDWLHVDKQWLCNVLYSLDLEGIKGMVTKARKLRKEKLETHQDLMVEMQPQFQEALKHC